MPRIHSTTQSVTVVPTKTRLPGVVGNHLPHPQANLDLHAAEREPCTGASRLHPSPVSSSAYLLDSSSEDNSSVAKSASQVATAASYSAISYFRDLQHALSSAIKLPTALKLPDCSEILH